VSRGLILNYEKSYDELTRELSRATILTWRPELADVLPAA
jgi:hypothetical protein